jgi:hypothetical protein
LDQLTLPLSSKRGAGAAVLRDHHGKVLAAQARWYGPILEALVTEAVAVREGVELVVQLGFTKVILETDNVVLTAALNLTAWTSRLLQVFAMIFKS